MPDAARRLRQGLRAPAHLDIFISLINALPWRRSVRFHPQVAHVKSRRRGCRKVWTHAIVHNLSRFSGDFRRHASPAAGWFDAVSRGAAGHF
jgi:hypothetical protein